MHDRGADLVRGSDTGLVPTITSSGPSPVSHLIACGCRAHAEVDEDGENPSIGVLTIGNVELEQQAPNMGFDGPFAEDQPFGDTSVRHPLRHQPEHLVLTLGEPGEAVLPGLAVEQRGDHLRSSAEPPSATRATASMKSETSSTRSFSR